LLLIVSDVTPEATNVAIWVLLKKVVTAASAAMQEKRKNVATTAWTVLRNIAIPFPYVSFIESSIGNRAKGIS
jgi:hypothetical protein